MERLKKTKYLHEGSYVAEIEVEVLEDEGRWSPYISINDAYRLDDLRDALRKGDLSSTVKYDRIYELRPVAHQ